MKRILLLLLMLTLAETVSAQKKNGRVSITDAQGTVSEGKMKRGEKNGEWKTTSKFGKLLTTETYVNGQLHGTFRRYYPNGNVSEILEFRNGKLNGIHVKFAMNGDTSEVLHYRNDTLNGYSFKVFPSFYFLSTRGYYVNGKKEGLWTEETKVGTMPKTDSMYYLNDSLHGVRRSYVNGALHSETGYAHGKKQGREIYYHLPEGNVAWVTYHTKGQRDSIYQEYDRAGNKVREMRYTSDFVLRSDSTWVVANQQRILSEAVVYNAKGVKTYGERNSASGPVGKFYFGDDGMIDSSLTFHATGKVSSRKVHVQTDMNKYSRIDHYYDWRYNDRGQLLSHGMVYGARKDGLWTWTDSTGKVTKRINYSGGNASGKYVSYYPNGKVKVQGVCLFGNLSDSIRVFSSAGKELAKGTPAYDAVFKQHLQDEQDVGYVDKEILIGEVTQEGDAGDAEIFIREESDPERVLMFAEEMPSFPGDSLNSYLQHNVVFPTREKEEGKQGIVYISFVVEKDGSITSVKPVKEVPGAPGLTQEAIRVVTTMPKWNPGKMNGRPVRVQVTIPVRFRLE